MGHGSARIARALGVREMTVRAIVRGDAPTVSTSPPRPGTDLYDAWWDKRAPERNRFERAAATAARRRAIRGNWCAGAGLDDDQLDTPGYKPTAKWKPATGTGTAPDTQPSPAEAPAEPAAGRPMALTINDRDITSDQTPHTARPAPGEEHQWEVSWLPGRRLPATRPSPRWYSPRRSPADAGQLDRMRPFIQGWADELGLTADQAATRTAAPPPGPSPRSPCPSGPTPRQAMSEPLRA